MGCNFKVSILSKREHFIKLKGNYIHCIFLTFVFYTISLKIITTCLQNKYIKKFNANGKIKIKAAAYTYILQITVYICFYVYISLPLLVSFTLNWNNDLQIGLAYQFILLIIQSHAFIYNPP